MTWKLQAITGEFAGKKVVIDRDMLVGRHQDADVLIQSADVSRRHAALFVKDSGLTVQDLGSSNGTFVNEQRFGEVEAALKAGDILKFASHQFSVLLEVAAETAPAAEQAVQQPVEAVATSEVDPVVLAKKQAAAKMQEQGMPDLKERHQDVQLTSEGMPQSVGVPKPAPIPEGVDIHAPASVPEACQVDVPESCVAKERETQKNANIGLISLLVLIVIALVIWFVMN